MNDLPFFAFIMALIAALYMMLFYEIATNAVEEKAIENGCAQYNPQTAEFEWLSPAD